MSSASYTRGLHPIYAALDSHQYHKVIKLCQQPQHAHNPLAAALLAHAYAKSGQRYKAVSTLHGIFAAAVVTTTTTVFPELQLELQYAAVLEESLAESALSTMNNHNAQQQQTTAANAVAAAKKPASAKKGGKKKQPSPSQQPQPPQTQKPATVPVACNNNNWDLIDQLDTPPTLPADWEQRIPPPNSPIHPDATLLATLSMTMLSVLKLPLTAYQLYCWAVTAASTARDNQYAADLPLYTRKAYLNGLALLLAPQYAGIHAMVLAHLQVLALQVARVQPTARLWAAQTALWQQQQQQGTVLLAAAATPTPTANAATTIDVNTNAPNSGNEDDEKQRQRLALLPRLAESLALKCVEEYCCHATATSNNNINDTANDNNDSSLLSTESFLLYMRTLDAQSKWTEKLAAVEQRLQTDTVGQQMSPPRQTILELKIQALQKMQDRATEIRETVEELLHMYPDDWEYWKQHLESSIAEAGGDLELGCAVTVAFVATILNAQSGGYPLRGPNLMRVELVASRAIAAPSDSAVSELVESIIRYGNDFAARASCIFSDLCHYLQVCLKARSIDQACALLQWSKELRSVEPASDDPKERRKQLRAYIFAVQVNFKVLFQFEELRDDELPSWEELVRVWKAFQSFENSEKVDQAQKESRPADELILLAVQRLLCKHPSTLEKMIAACLLESAIRYSPYNAYLKICAMFVYGDLNAASRSWELYNELYIKHIQNESCAYLILPLLRSCGLYREMISVCQEIIGLQRTSGREAADYTARAMESGAVSKAEEFLVFHRERMTKSLTTLEAKGLILDAAPMLVRDNEGELGAAHGIVGGDTDLERVKQMVAEAHNANGAFSLLQLRGPVEESTKNFSENRDFGVLSYELLVKQVFDTPEQIVGESIRRGHQHSILIRAALCVDAAKGPKKGKTTKSSPALEKRCKSLLAAVDEASESVDSIFQAAGCGKLLLSMNEMCFAIVALGAGMNKKGEPVVDALDAREEAMVIALRCARKSVDEARRELTDTNDMSVSRTSRLLSDSIAPLFAVFQMCAKLADLFGWGRRKRKTKRCAGAVADFALAFALLVGDMMACFDSLPTGFLLSDPDIVERLSGSVDETMVTETCNVVLESQRCTRSRVETILNYVKGCLDAFDVDD